MQHKNNPNSKYGPLQIVHDFKFTALNVKDDYSLVDKLDYADKVTYIKSRIDRLHRLGYGGVVMNVDYKEYLKVPEAFTLFFECAKYAKEIGMRVWIYDEQYYPSGSAGGITLEGHPELEAIGLACISKDFKTDETVGAIRVASPCGYSELKYAIIAPILNGEVQHSQRKIISDYKDLAGGLCYDAPNGEWRVWCFFIRPLYELTKFCQGMRASRRYVSVFNKKAIERFYDVTFNDGYKKHTDAPLSNLVEAVFTDEPYSPFYKKTENIPTRTHMPSCSIYDESNNDIKIYPYIPWEISVPELYEARYGRSIVHTLPDIFDNTPQTKEARISFFSLLSDMSKEAFAEQMSEKLGKEGVLLSGHYYGEEAFDFHPIFHGDILDHLSVMGIPGCDCLWSDIDIIKHYTACKIGSSAAHLALRDEVMIEASNMVDRDQNITLQKVKAAISAMFIHGINLITSYYSENLLPDDEMCEFTAHISSLTKLFRGSKYRINTFLYYPFENLCADSPPLGINEGNDNGQDTLGITATSVELMKHQVCFDFINKKKLLTSKIHNGYIEAPNGEKVKYLVFPNIEWIDSEIADYINTAHKNGVHIIFNGQTRDICNLLFTPSFIECGCYPKSNLSLVTENHHITLAHRAFDDHDLFMLLNTDSESHDIKIKVKDTKKLALVNLLTGEDSDINIEVIDDAVYANINIPSLDTVIIKKIHS